MATRIFNPTPRGSDVEMNVGKLIENDKAARLAAVPQHP